MHFSIISFFLYSTHSRHIGGTEGDKNVWRKRLFAGKEQNKFLNMGSHHLGDVPRLVYDQKPDQLKKTRETQPVEDVGPIEGSSDKPYPEDDGYYRPRRFTTDQVDVEVTAEYGSKWNMDNNCGPRPSGPKYPAPPDASAEQYKKQFHCDIIPDAVYLPGYRCNTTCQNDETVTVSLYCDCYNNFLNFAVVKPCEWVFIDDVSCPPVADPPNWECDPRVEGCGDTYPTPEPPTTTTPATTATAILTTTSTPSTETTSSLAVTTDDWMEGLHSSWLQWQAQKASTTPVGDGKDVSGFAQAAFGATPYGGAPNGGVNNIFNIQPVLSNAMGNSGMTDPISTQPISTKNNLTDDEVENLKTEILLMKNQRTSIQEQLDEIRREMAL